MPGLSIQWQIPLAMALAVVAGLLAGDSATVAGLPLAGIFDFLGTLFVSALKMLVIPLVCSSVILGVARGSSNLGRLCVRTLSFFLVTAILAILMGLAVVNAVEPGIVDGRPAGDMIQIESSNADLPEDIADRGFGDILDVFLSVVPNNVVSAAAADDLLGVMFFSVLFGYFMARLEHDYAEPLFRFWTGVRQIMMRMTEWVMMFAPVGVFGLVARSVAKTGFAEVKPVLAFTAVVLVALAGHVLVTLPILVRFLARVSPAAMYRAVAPAFLTALSTASSAATLPLTLECVQKRAGVSNRVSSFVLPLGATANMNGTALYVAVAAVFLAQAYGAHLDLNAQALILALAVVTSVGLPGIPSVSLGAIAIILSVIGLPTEALGILVVFDRLLEMARTAVNVLGDTACAVIIARLEGEEGVLTGRPAPDEA